MRVEVGMTVAAPAAVVRVSAELVSATEVIGSMTMVGALLTLNSRVETVIAIKP